MPGGDLLGRTRNPFCALAAALAISALGASVVRADPPHGAKAAIAALDRGDNDAAVRLFSELLLYGSPDRSGREFAYAKRAEALLAMGRYGDAAADAKRALALRPGDAEALEVRNKALALAMAPAPPFPPRRDTSDALNAKVRTGLDAVAARNRAAFETYQAQMADYDAKKAAIEVQAKADNEAYAADLAAHQAEVDDLARKNAAAIADWKGRVAACKSGDRSQCAHRSAGEGDQGAPGQPPEPMKP